MRLTGRRAPWLSLTGGSLTIAGYARYLGVAALSAPVLAMAGADGPAAVFARDRPHPGRRLDGRDVRPVRHR
jgi:hypothetical protein